MRGARLIGWRARVAWAAATAMATTAAIGCGNTSTGNGIVRGGRPTQLRRNRVLAAARAFLGGAPLEARGYDFPPDPVGFVRAAYYAVGMELFERDAFDDRNADAIAVLYRSAKNAGQLHRETPRPADLVFFDSDSSRRALTPRQVGIVERVDVAGTITAMGLFAKGPTRVRLNLRRPRIGEETAKGRRRILNDTMIGAERKLASQLFRAFCDPFF